MTDLAVRLLCEGYTAIERDRAARGGQASYETRVLGRSAVVLGGKEGARLFYDEDVVRRSGAVPPARVAYDLELVGPVAGDLTRIPTLPPVGLRVRIR